MDIVISSVIEFLTHWVWPIFLFIFGLGVVVFVHELGHFLIAKAVGIKVERFAIGFGPRICGYRGKETDYSIMLLPLGGYVKMLGQEDFAPLEDGEGKPDPRAYSSKSVGARFAVISAGVIMNVIFAAIMFMIIGMIGMPVQAPVVGGTVPGSPASMAKITWLDDSDMPIDAKDPAYPADQPETLQSGDRMTKIEGDGGLQKVLGSHIGSFKRVLMQAVLSDETDKYTLWIKRTVDGEVLTGKVVDLGLKMSPSPSGSGGMIPSFGIIPASSTTLSLMDGYVQGADKIFKKNDKIVALDGRKLEHNWDIRKIQKTLLGRPVQVTVERTVDGKTTRVDLDPIHPMVLNPTVFYLEDGKIIRCRSTKIDKEKGEITLRSGKGDERTEQTVSIESLTNIHYDPDIGILKERLDVLGMIPRIQIGAVREGSPAHKAGLRSGDVIERYGNHSAPTHLELRELNATFASDGANIVVMRDGKTLPPVSIKPKMHGDNAQIGIIVNSDLEHLVVAGVRENSQAAKLDIQNGDTIEKVNGQDVSTWPDLLAALSNLQDKEVTLSVRRGDNHSAKIIPSLSKLIFDKSDYVSRILPEPWHYKRLMDPKTPRGPLAALVWGCRETMFFIATNYATIRSLINRTVSTKELSGPLGIGSMAIAAGRRSMIEFAYFMAMISACLAVVNFLPFPVVDGGHAVFLIIEKIRGKPLSIRVMNVIQLTGLAIILMVVVYVTWNDISRIWGG